MRTYSCPHCKQPGISALRRACLGPAIPATCSSCGRKVGVPWSKSCIASTPFVLAMLATALIPSVAVSAVVLVFGAVAMFALFFLYVPLERR